MEKKKFPGQIWELWRRSLIDMDSKLKLIVDSLGLDRFKLDEPIKEHTFLKVGGPAKLFFISFTTSELVKIVKMCRELKVPFFIFGSGSKIMISDLGFDGLVIKNRTKNIHTVSVKGKVSKIGIGVEEALIEVESGLSVAKFAEALDLQGLSSGEFSNIPGTIGGNLFVNRFLQMKAKSIKVLDRASYVEEIEVFELRSNLHIILSAVFKIKAKE